MGAVGILGLVTVAAVWLAAGAVAVATVAWIAAWVWFTFVRSGPPRPPALPVPTLAGQPTNVCPGGSSTLTWASMGDSATLSADRHVPGLPAAVAATGRRDVVIPAPGTTRLTLTATGSGRSPASNVVTVTAIDARASIQIGGRPRCQDRQGLGLHWIALQQFAADQWAEGIRVHRVAYALGTMTFFSVYFNDALVLDGTVAEVDLGGVPIIGEWRLMRPLEPDEPCEPNSPGYRAPPGFVISAQVRCA